MRLGVLFSGGKDSTLALHKAAEREEVVCLITLVSENKESFMFHTPNIDLTALQAEALGLPLIRKVTAGEPEKELKDLEEAIAQTIKTFKIEGIVFRRHTVETKRAGLKAQTQRHVSGRTRRAVGSCSRRPRRRPGARRRRSSRA